MSRNSEKKAGRAAFIRAALVLAALAGAGAIVYILWRQGRFLPSFIVWRDGELRDEGGSYELLLEDRAADIRWEGKAVWASPEGLRVQEGLFADIDGDGEEELVLLGWRIGRFGRDRPFWVRRDERKWSQHLLVYELDGEEIRPKWISSYLGVDVAQMSSERRQTDRERILFTDPEGRVSAWRWDSWGFVREETEISFVVLGDNLIHEPIYRYGLSQDSSFSFLYEGIGDAVAQSDVAVINQETPLVEDPALYGGYPRFGTPVNVGQAIADAGFDVVTCATNHALDRGEEGIGFTREFFARRQILCIGTQSPGEEAYRPMEILVKNGARFGLLNYTYGTNGISLPEDKPFLVHLLEEDRIREDLEKAAAESDFVIVFVHWGTEDSPSTDEFQRKWAQVFLEGGADVVVGTHPHVLQPVEVMRDGQGNEMLIYYSIGNYISAQREKACVKGGMARFTVSLAPEGYRISRYSLQPLCIERQEGGLVRVSPLYDISPQFLSPPE